jgi:hypothetical protein
MSEVLRNLNIDKKVSHRNSTTEKEAISLFVFLELFFYDFRQNFEAGGTFRLNFQLHNTNF